MTQAFKQFEKNIESVETIAGIHSFFESQVQALDLSEILRAEFVLLISAFDNYVHDLVRERMLEIFDGTRPRTNDYEKFQVSLLSAENLLANDLVPLRRQILEAEIRQVTTKYSYQSPTSVERTMKLIVKENIWKLVARKLKIARENIVKELGLIVNRRNKIAHEADVDPITLVKSSIDRKTVQDAKTFLVRIVRTIDDVN